MSAFHARAEITLDEADRVLEDLLEHLAEHVTVIRTEGGARLESPFGTVDIVQLADLVLVDVAAPTAEILDLIRQFVAEHVHEFAGEGGARILWQGGGATPDLPPRFRETRVLHAYDVTPGMRRVVLACPDPSWLASEGGYHVRLLIPPAGRKPQWPVQRPDGRLDWPKGEDALASRVYTIRSFDAAAGTIDIDFVLHGHAGPDALPSPGADFARRASAGDLVGLIGPGGDGRPEGLHLLLLGDESALPAIARMLSEVPSGTRVAAFIEVADSAEIQLMNSAAELDLTWIIRSDQPETDRSRLEEIASDLARSGELDADLVWGGCEKSVAARIRAVLVEAFPDRRKDLRIQAYWTQA